MSKQVEQAKRAAEAGFTLIELMIVIAIIGILAAIAIPQYEQYIETSKATTIAQDFHQAVTQSTAAVAAAAAGQTTSLPIYGSLPSGVTLSVKPTSYTASDSQNSTPITVTLGAGKASSSLQTAVAQAISSMNITGSTGSAIACPGASCTVIITSNGGISQQ